MHIVIFGGGRTGRELALRLSQKNQSVVIIEKDPEIAKILEEKLDVLVINDSAANMAALNKAGIKKANIFIAVSPLDELNLMVCMMATRAKVPVTIARVRNPKSYSNIAETGFSKDEMGVDYVINPERELALEITKMIHFPDAVEIEYFAEGRVMLVATKVTDKAKITGQNLKNLSLPEGCLIVGIKRADGNFIIPNGKDTVRVGDTVYLIGDVKVMNKASRLLHHEKTKVKKVVILGGEKVGSTLASILENSGKGLKIKLIEKEKNRCDELKRLLNKTLVLPGDSSELVYFDQEEIAEADVLITVTGDDRNNILSGIMGKNLGVKKMISEITRNEYAHVYDIVGIDDYIDSQLITAYKILRFTRKVDVISLLPMKEERAEVMELRVPVSCKVVGKKLSDAHFPKGMLIGTIVRGDEVIIPNGKTFLKPEDRLIVFNLTGIGKRLEQFFC